MSMPAASLPLLQGITPLFSGGDLSSHHHANGNNVVIREEK
jgi:hypothetical protein